MANPARIRSETRSFKYGGLSVLFTVIFIVAVVLVNVIITLLGDRFMPTADLTDSGLYSIEQSTVDYLKTVTDEVTITVTSEEAAFYRRQFLLLSDKRDTEEDRSGEFQHKITVY